MYPLIPYLSLAPPFSPQVTSSLFSISWILFLFKKKKTIFTILFFDSSYKWYHTVSVFLWLISLSIIPSKTIHAVANGKISFFSGWVVLHFTYIPTAVNHEHLWKLLWIFIFCQPGILGIVPGAWAAGFAILQQFPPFLTPEMGFAEDKFFTGWGWAGGFRGRFEMIQAHYIYCVLYFYYYYISTTSDHQALDTRDWQPQLYCTLECFKSPSGLLATVITPWNKWHCFHGYDLLGSFQPPFVALCL